MKTVKLNKKYIYEKYKESLKKKLDKNGVKYHIVPGKKVDVFVIKNMNFLGSITCQLTDEGKVLIHYVFATENDIEEEIENILDEIRHKTNLEGVVKKRDKEDCLKYSIAVKRELPAFSSQNIVKDYKNLSAVCIKNI